MIIFGQQPERVRLRLFIHVKKYSPAMHQHQNQVKTPWGEQDRLCQRNCRQFLESFEGKKVVGATGIEPATSWSQTKCSTRLSYAPIPTRSKFRQICLVGPQAKTMTATSCPIRNEGQCNSLAHHADGFTKCDLALTKKEKLAGGGRPTLASRINRQPPNHKWKRPVLNQAHERSAWP